jgi:hypothetical protein
LACFWKISFSKIETYEKESIVITYDRRSYLGSFNCATNRAKVNPGGIYIKGATNAANISVNKDGTTNDAKTLSTFHIGAIADIPLAPVLSFQTGLLLTGKGAKSTSMQMPVIILITMSKPHSIRYILSYLQILLLNFR